MSILQILVAGLLLGVVVDGIRNRRAKGSKNLPAEILEEKPEEFILDPDDFAKCHLAESDCNLKDMKEATLVYTDSDTSRCWNGEPFAFLVHPGLTDKLLYYFPGGGACWEIPFQLPGAVPICSPTLKLGLTATGYGKGVMDFSNPSNVFRDYTVVSPPYCMGGAHVANTTVKGSSGTKYQHDYNNNEFARTWAMKNVDQSLASFVIMGSSAGSLGAMAWSDLMLSTFQYEKASVILDSYMGVFPEDTQGPTIQTFNVCNLPIWKHFQESCLAGRSNIQDIFDFTVGKHPDVAFAHIQPKGDAVQIGFYSAIAASYLMLDLILTPKRLYKISNSYMERFNRHGNYVAYIIDGSFHTFTWWGYWYLAAVTGKGTLLTGKPADSAGKPTLAEWAAKFVNHEKVRSECNGRLRDRDRVLVGTRYCDEKVFPKTLTLKR